MLSGKKMWAKVWVRRKTHILTHYTRRPKSTGQDVPDAFWSLFLYITCSMKLPIVSAALSCI